jgi:hypothetical protein
MKRIEDAANHRDRKNSTFRATTAPTSGLHHQSDVLTTPQSHQGAKNRASLSVFKPRTSPATKSNVWKDLPPDIATRNKVLEGLVSFL